MYTRERLLNMTSVKAEHISYTYMKGTPFEKKALYDVSFEIKQGSFTGIIGHTGCGKSTLIQHFNGLLLPDAGKLYIDDKPIEEHDIKALRKRVGLVFQYPEYQLFESTVYKDIAFGIKSENLTKDEERKRVIEAAMRTGLSEKLLDKSIYELSGGQKRRAAIAGIIVMQPEILVLDEPAAGLDPAGREEILQFAKNLCINSGVTVVLVSHSMEDIARYADHIIVMNRGRTEMSGSPYEIFKNEERLTGIGLEIPQITNVLHSLARKFPELGINKEIFTEEEAAEEIMRVVCGSHKNINGGEGA